MPSLSVVKTVNFENSADAHFVVVRTEDSSVFVGGLDKKLSKYDKDFNLVGYIDLKSFLYCAITLTNMVVCGKYES